MTPARRSGPAVERPDAPDGSDRNGGSGTTGAAEATEAAGPAALPLTSLSGVGPVRAARLAHLGLCTVADLLVHTPRRLDASAGRVTIAEAAEHVGQDVTLAGRLGSPRLFRRGRRRSVLSASLTDATGKLDAHWFNQPWFRERVAELAAAGGEVELSGRVIETKKGVALGSPRLASDEDGPGLRCVYPTTAGIGQSLLRQLCLDAADAWHARLEEPLDPATLAELDVPALGAAVHELHRPSSEEAHERARRRLALERLLVLQARLRACREGARSGAARACVLDARERTRLLERLPFAPTAGQRAVIDEIFADLARTAPMRRLLQGEVGSGKTLVGLAASLAVLARGGQVALLAPTEVLAEQHAIGLAPWVEAAGSACTLLSGSLGTEARRDALDSIAAGRAQLVVGTHALFSAAVRFQRLDLVVIDEQQRFGVAQKESLLRKGRDVHALLMTATPIPRTLALTLYGDLDQSVLTELPPGRGETRTHVVEPARLARLRAFLGERLAEGERVFWVCPRIDADESAAATRAFDELRRGPAGRHGVELVHGRLPADERAARIERFRRGDANVLVSTSLIEVGVDVPEATVMVIDDAERFGLAQLHQLRGRVGRGRRRSWCLLLAPRGGSERLALLEEATDGFRIAEEDLRLRGMGDLVGRRQAGVNAEGLAHPDLDLELVLLARRLVRGDRALAERYRRQRSIAPALV